ncbi:MAG TPA: hypothetical protein VFQ53_07700 [Kofleriaceae bacterium]|nr:hypothetical protein [Kofleriaceae bacterium]
MTFRLALASLLVVSAASVAYAQAPGEMEPVAPPSSVAPAAPVAPLVVAPDPRATLMARRFAVGLNVGGMSVAPQGSDGADEVSFNSAELSLRFRMTPRLELELLLNGGRQVLEDDTQGDLAMGGGTLGLRYRFRPYRHTGWWLLAGVGETIIARHDASESERDAAGRPHFAFGAGLEHRFTNWALNAELRMLAIGPRSDAMDAPTVDGMPVPPDPTFQSPSDELSGGTFTIGASYYF